MRIDKFLKVSRVIKRRSVANEACDFDRVMINDKLAKASTRVKCGDIVSIKFGERIIKFEVTSIDEVVKKEQASSMYRIIEE